MAAAAAAAAVAAAAATAAELVGAAERKPGETPLWCSHGYAMTSGQVSAAPSDG